METESHLRGTPLISFHSIFGKFGRRKKKGMNYDFREKEKKISTNVNRTCKMSFANEKNIRSCGKVFFSAQKKI